MVWRGWSELLYVVVFGTTDLCEIVSLLLKRVTSVCGEVNIAMTAISKLPLEYKQTPAYVVVEAGKSLQQVLPSHCILLCQSWSWKRFCFLIVENMGMPSEVVLFC
ncbi:hypothetical protein RJT34_14367 [Clitoria ternatea]|uniref:Uncharacterized protein n=1 Tax=Clitoria ternatea TaxID=43366 RepID=A0AAN9JQA3_CLITE